MRRRRTADEIARLLREADRDLAKGITVSESARTCLAVKVRRRYSMRPDGIFELQLAAR
jgi:hypothetical protein